MKNKKSTWAKICNTMTPFCSLVVAFEEFFNGRFLSGIGWFSAAFAWWALFKEEKAFDELYEMFLNRLEIDLQMTKAYIGKLKEYEGDKLSGTICVQNGNRNCDVYRTVEEAMEACFKDRGYCNSPVKERESTIMFMLSDVKDNSFNKTTDDVEEDMEEVK